MTDIRLSYSSLNSLLRCERQFTMRYVEGIVQDGPPSVQQALGSWVHAMAAAHNLKLGAEKASLLVRPSSLDIIDGLVATLDQDLAEMAVHVHGELCTFVLAPSGILTMCQMWWGFQPEDWQAAFEEKYGESLPDRVKNMWIRYRLKWRHTDANRLPLLVEHEWSRPTGDSEGDPLLQGRIDLLYYDTERNLTVLSDLKTAASWPSDTERETAMWDSQLQIGLWGIQPVVLSAPTSPDVGANYALEYDRLRTKKPSLPKLVKGRTKEGPERVLSKSACDTDAYTYRAWLGSEEALEAGVELSEEYLAELESDEHRWFRRGLIPENPATVAIHLQAAVRTAARIPGLTLDSAVPFPSTMGCAGCSYRTACGMTLLGVNIRDVELKDLGLRYRDAPEARVETAEEEE